MEVADDRHPHAKLVEAVHDFRNSRGRLFGIHRDADQFGAGARQRHYLIHGAGHIGGVGVGHGLHDNRMIAANFDTCYVYHYRCSAELHCHRSSRGTLILALWVFRPLRGPYCLIGGLAAIASWRRFIRWLRRLWFVTHCTLRRLPANSASSSRLTTGYQVFLARAVEAEVLGVRAKIACLEEVTRATLWAYGDPRRRLSKRKEGEFGFDPPDGGVSG